MNGLIRVLLLLTLFGNAAFAKEDDNEEKTNDSEVAQILNSMGYPELQVVPRASERLRLEAKEERGSWFVTHWPIELSGLATLTTGFMADDNQRELSSKDQANAKTVNTFTQVVGTAWIAGGLVLGGMKPYGNGYRGLSKGPAKDERAALLRERLAEEALERPARTMRILRHVSVLSNFSMNVLSGVYQNDKGRVIAGVGAVLSFLPYMFEDHSVATYEKHLDYKRKIYTPLKGASVHLDPETGKMTPLTTLTWNF